MTRSIQVESSARQMPCDLCGRTRFDLIARTDRRREPLATVVCKHCGLVSHETIPSDDELEVYYESVYRQDYHGEIEPSPHRVLRARHGGTWLLKLLRPHVQPGSRVFEVGAGIGCTVKAFAEAGFSASGIEPGVGFHRFSRRSLGVQIARKSLLDLPPQPQYDFVLLVHVIEHFNSPRRALDHIHSILRPGGRLYVECPNVAAPHTAPSKLFHYAHIYNFTPPTLVSLAQTCGFQVHEQLSGDHARALRFVFERVESRAQCVPTQSYEHTLARLQTYSDLTYHLRLSYLADRAWRDVRFMSNRLFARTRVHRWLRPADRHSCPVPTTSG